MKKLTDLTPEEKRVLCAEACGFSWRSNGFGYRFLAKKGGCGPDAKSEKCTDALRKLPPYHTSLDAMATAEATLEWSETDACLDALARIVDPAHGYRMELTFAVVTATAEQRLDAFLLAKGICK